MGIALVALVGLVISAHDLVVFAIGAFVGASLLNPLARWLRAKIG